MMRLRFLPISACGATLALMLALPLSTRAHAQAAAVEGAQAGAMQLHIVIEEGENALNNIRQRTAREPVIQIEDENHKPVAGAAIVFLVHGGNSGAGGAFAGSQTFSTTTDATGHATGTGFTANQIAGNFTIVVTATVGMATISATIHQSNVLGGAVLQRNSSTARHGRIFTRNFWVTTGVAAATAGTVAAIVLLTNSNGATITAGAGGVGHP